jgi:mono/diheme cytochrome c family protein
VSSRALLAIGASILLVSGCTRQKESTAVEYMPDMAYGPRVAAQHEDPMRPGESVMRPPVPGTVPRDYTPYRYAQADSLLAQAELVNPLPRTAAVMERGRTVYSNTCIVCHGPQGDGQGYIVPLYPMPPTLHSAKVRGWPDGRIFHVISRGQNLMPSYATQIVPEDRWAVVHFVRALQRSHAPAAADTVRAGTSPAAGAAPGTPASPDTAGRADVGSPAGDALTRAEAAR